MPYRLPKIEDPPVRFDLEEPAERVLAPAVWQYGDGRPDDLWREIRRGLLMVPPRLINDPLFPLLQVYHFFVFWISRTFGELRLMIDARRTIHDGGLMIVVHEIIAVTPLVLAVSPELGGSGLYPPAM